MALARRTASTCTEVHATPRLALGLKVSSWILMTSEARMGWRSSEKRMAGGGTDRNQQSGADPPRRLPMGARQSSLSAPAQAQSRCAAVLLRKDCGIHRAEDVSLPEALGLCLKPFCNTPSRKRLSFERYAEPGIPGSAQRDVSTTSMGETHLLLDSKRGREGEREREGKQADSGWHASSCREVSPGKTNPGRRAGFSEAGTAKASQFHLRVDIVALATAWPTGQAGPGQGATLHRATHSAGACRQAQAGLTRRHVTLQSAFACIPALQHSGHGGPM